MDESLGIVSGYCSANENLLTAQDKLNDVLNNVTPPLGSCCVNYGTIRYGPLDSEFNPVLHPKVLSVEMEPRSIARWEEVDSQIRRLIHLAYSMHSRRPPPFSLLHWWCRVLLIQAAVASMSDVSNKLGDAPHPTQPFQQRVHIGHSIGKEGAQRDYGTMCCVLGLVDENKPSS